MIARLKPSILKNDGGIEVGKILGWFTLGGRGTDLRNSGLLHCPALFIFRTFTRLNSIFFIRKIKWDGKFMQKQGRIFILPSESS